jgi:hypothetical protein
MKKPIGLFARKKDPLRKMDELILSDSALCEVHPELPNVRKEMLSLSFDDSQYCTESGDIGRQFIQRLQKENGLIHLKKPELL